MNRSIAFQLAYGSTVFAAVAAAALVAGSARAEGPILMEDSTPFVSTRSRAEVRAEVLASADAIRAGASEWARQQHAPMAASGRTRAEVTAEYIGVRDQVHAFNSEDSGSAYLAAAAPQQGTPAGLMLARQEAR